MKQFDTSATIINMLQDAADNARIAAAESRKGARTGQWGSEHYKLCMDHAKEQDRIAAAFSVLAAQLYAGRPVTLKEIIPAD